jgi:hypothetical protein
MICCDNNFGFLYFYLKIMFLFCGIVILYQTAKKIKNRPITVALMGNIFKS